MKIESLNSNKVFKMSDKIVIKKPIFGDIILNEFASESNPIRKGIFVKSYRKNGIVNKGVTWYLTNGNGYFWDVQPCAEIYPTGEKWIA